MVNSVALKAAMKSSGYTRPELCKMLNMSRSALYRKTIGKSEFTVDEMMLLVDILQLASPADVFFSKKV